MLILFILDATCIFCPNNLAIAEKYCIARLSHSGGCSPSSTPTRTLVTRMKHLWLTISKLLITFTEKTTYKQKDATQ